jgi:hypothetical protein
MDAMWTVAIWRQFGAAIDMFESAIRACPDELWSAPLWNESKAQPESSEFWYIVYHTLFWLDLYLSGSVEVFAAPFAGQRWTQSASGTPLRKPSFDYLDHCRRNCQTMIEALTDEVLASVRIPLGNGQLR